jgi:hypothetical protein
VHAWPNALAHEDSNANLLYICDVMKHKREETAELFEEALGYTPDLENDIRTVLDDSVMLMR